MQKSLFSLCSCLITEGGQIMQILTSWNGRPNVARSVGRLESSQSRIILVKGGHQTLPKFKHQLLKAIPDPACAPESHVATLSCSASPGPLWRTSTLPAALSVVFDLKSFSPHFFLPLILTFFIPAVLSGLKHRQ